ncbi:MAG: ribosome silencing factor [Pseudomonadota bacterium]
MTSEAAAKKDTQKLQRAIVDGLEDVKAQDIQVFDTEHLSPLFERVIVASGTSNRQTKALAASVRDAVREAGFGKPRIEGETNGEWIIVDCGAAVAHIMQPAIRQYYHLEDIWGDKPVRLKLGAAKPTAAPVADKEPAKKTAVKTSLRRASAAKTAIKEAEQAARAEKEQSRPARARRAPVKNVTATRGAAPAKKVAAKKAPAKTAAKPTIVKVGKPPAKKVAAKKTAARKTPARGQ